MKNKDGELLNDYLSSFLSAMLLSSLKDRLLILRSIGFEIFDEISRLEYFEQKLQRPFTTETKQNPEKQSLNMLNPWIT